MHGGGIGSFVLLRGAEGGGLHKRAGVGWGAGLGGEGDAVGGW